MIKSVKIFGTKIKVELDDSCENHGEYHIDDKKIVLDANLSQSDQWATFFHECCHAALKLGGVAYMLTEKQEEAVVRAIEQGVWPVVRTVIVQALGQEGKE